MKRLIKVLFLTLLSSNAISQTFFKEYLNQKAKVILTPDWINEEYIVDFDEKGLPIYAQRKVSPFNFGIEPVLLDSLTFYKSFQTFIEDSNFVFGELRIDGFDGFDCLFCEPESYFGCTCMRNSYRFYIGEAVDESNVKNKKFIFYFIGLNANNSYYLHIIRGVSREF